MQYKTQGKEKKSNEIQIVSEITMTLKYQ